MNVEETKNELHKLLRNQLDYSGSILYSSIETLKKGDYYILGLNPGGDPNAQDYKQNTIRKHIDELHNKHDNSYINEDWGHGAGKHPLQLSLKEILKKLDVDIKEVFACNLIFRRTKSARDLEYSEGENYWLVHELFLDIINPKTIITIGNSKSNSAFSFLQAKFKSYNFEEPFLFSKSNKPIIQYKFFNTEKFNVIGLPHLSRYSYISKNEEFLNWLQKKVNESVWK